jgi:hypothetical protein
MERFPDFGEQAGDSGSTASSGASDLPRPVAEWAEGMRAGFITPLPEEALRYQAALAAETARLATETVATTETQAARWFRRGRRNVVFKRTAGRLAAQLGVAFVALVLVAGGAAAAAGVDVPGLLKKPFTHSEQPAVDGSDPAAPGTTVLTGCDDDLDGDFDDDCGDTTVPTTAPGTGCDDDADGDFDDDCGTGEADDAADQADDAAELTGCDDDADGDFDDDCGTGEADDAAEDAADDAADAAEEAADDAADAAEDAADDAADAAEDAADDAADDAEDAGERP